MRPAVVLLAIRASVMMAPLAPFPDGTFTRFPSAPAFEGVPITEDWVLLGGAMVVDGRLDEAAD